MSETFLTGLLLALVPTGVGIVWGIISNYFTTKAIKKELDDNTANDQKTREELSENSHKLAIIENRLRELNSKSQETDQDIKKTLHSIDSKVDEMFKRKKDYIDNEINRVESRIDKEITNMRSTRKEDVRRIDLLITQINETFNAQSQKLEGIATSLSELRGIIKAQNSK